MLPTNGIFTTTDGLALDTISISRAFDRDEDELRRAERVAKVIEKALRGEIRLTDAVAEKAGAPREREMDLGEQARLVGEGVAERDLTDTIATGVGRGFGPAGSTTIASTAAMKPNGNWVTRSAK